MWKPVAALFVVSTFVVSALAAACSSGSKPAASGGGCDTTFDTNCDEAIPSWSTDVQPLLQKYCDNCHTDGGPGESLFNSSSYKTVHAGATSMLTQMNECLMPLPDATPPQAYPTDEERQTILSWIACGSPEN
ncbi:MAG TPA: hypothetical protein VGG39_28030 [Polyangiaceae bacterium]|jgi:hypothetical protein